MFAEGIVSANDCGAEAETGAAAVIAEMASPAAVCPVIGESESVCGDVLPVGQKW